MAKRTPPPPTTSSPARKQRTNVFLVPAVQAPTHETIAARAFELYLGRSGQPGDELSDWLQAEAELSAQAR